MMSSFSALSTCTINDGVSRTKKKYQGGIKHIFLFPFVKLNRSAIFTNGVYLEGFPITDIYKFDVQNISYRENTKTDSAGVSWSEDLSFDVPFTTPSSELYKLSEKDYRAIVVDRIGNIRIIGLYNGLEVSVTNESGTDKQNLNGYRINLKGQEENQAYFLNDLSLFRVAEVENYIFEDGCNYIFEDGTNYIF